MKAMVSAGDIPTWESWDEHQRRQRILAKNGKVSDTYRNCGDGTTGMVTATGQVTKAAGEARNANGVAITT